MWFTSEEILETIRMIELEHLDIRTVTMGINLLDCAHEDPAEAARRMRAKIASQARDLVTVVNQVATDFGVPIVNRRIAVTPIAMVGAASRTDTFVPFAVALDRAAEDTGVDYLGGFSALVHKGVTRADAILMESIPEALNATHRVCSSVNVATTKAGINMDAVLKMGQIVCATAAASRHTQGAACTKLVVFANIPEDNPFVAGAMHGPGEGDCAINVGISGPGVVRAIVEKLPGADFGELSEAIKRTAFKITRMGELVGREVSKRLGVPFGIIDLSLAPTPAPGDSVANILEAMGLERCGTHGSTAALAMLNDAVKKGGAMATSYNGGLSGAFIPVMEDQGMCAAVEAGVLRLDKLEAMTSVCSVGLDMVAVPGDTPPETIAAIIADEMAIGVINNKTTAVRIIPVPGKQAGERVEFGGLMGGGMILPVHRESARAFVHRGGRIPPPLQSLGN